jgi:olefin beta-lactone synthetase
MANANIISLFLESAEKSPHVIAFVQDKEQISYQQLERSIKRSAEELRKQGIEAGDRVLVFIPMSITLYKTVLSLF